VTATLILTAAELEARRLARALELPRLHAGWPAWGRDRVRLAPIGLSASELATRWAALTDGLDRPLVVAAGVCGALVADLRRGDLVLPGRVLAPSGVWLTSAGDRLRTAMDGAGLLAHEGAVVTSAHVVRTPGAKAELRQRTGAVAVDMESAFVLMAAARAGYPAAVLRGVSDEVGTNLPWELTRLLARDGRLRAGRAALLAVTRPAAIPQALALKRGTDLALDGLARVLLRLIA
jgi:nucleoside phosphorylase